MYRIMLVDDEMNILSALKRALLTIPFDDLDGERPEIETFVSARQALARIAGKPVDLVITDFRMPIGRHNGSATALFWAKFMPGSVHKKHRHDNCEELYYVISGHGVAGAGPDRAKVRGGHVHYIPKGVEHFMYNTSKTEPLEVIGIYIGAGSVDKTGYVYTGDVTPADLEVSTS